MPLSTSTINLATRFSLRFAKNFRLCSCRQISTAFDKSTDLKEVLSKKIPAHNKRVFEFKKQYGATEIQNITVDMVYGGMRSIKGMVCETSVLDPGEGIRFRGYSIPECRKLLPRAHPDGEPLPEGIFWLLCTGDIPTREQTTAISEEWASRASLPDHVVEMLNALPSSIHPMSQFVAGIAALSNESLFAKAYRRGIHKSTYWEFIYEDSMNLIAKLPTLAAVIYRNLYREGDPIASIDPTKDWSANFATMLGYDDPSFADLMRLYLTIHCDHEGGNVSAHTCHLVGSALSDPFLSFSAAMAGLAGPLHGLANQEVLLRDSHSSVIPGYGHAVLRITDPRYDCQREFALKHLPDDEMFKLVEALYKVTPDILIEHGKAQNPWPNVDAH
ncbi:unnamed protein product, partial [Anisakis simplex]|uniref:Citrate synthase n=1 Tax=Anisakis simplex TaxID=6269 RepID=A0A0M3K529_ANISI